MVLKTDLSTLPLGTLRRARHALTHAKVDSDSESDASESDAPDQPDDGPILKGKEKNKAEWSIKPRSDIAKRSNKHA
jgi:ribosomal RNA-processing protein 36